MKSVIQQEKRLQREKINPQVIKNLRDQDKSNKKMGQSEITLKSRRNHQ